MYVLWKTERKQMKLEESLIISYSYSGNTHRLAEQIQAVTQGNWMEIYPRQPYPVTFPELLEQVNAAMQELKDDGTLQSIIDKYIPADGE